MENTRLVVAVMKGISNKEMSNVMTSMNCAQAESGNMPTIECGRDDTIEILFDDVTPSEQVDIEHVFDICGAKVTYYTEPCD